MDIISIIVIVALFPTIVFLFKTQLRYLSSADAVTSAHSKLLKSKAEALAQSWVSDIPE